MTDAHYLSPEGMAKSGSEDAHQAALICWANRAARIGFAAADDMSRYGKLDPELQNAIEHNLWANYPLHWLHAIPNGGSRDGATAGRMKQTGVKSGVWDLFLPYARNGYHGFYIEMKVKNNALQPNQLEFQAFIFIQKYYQTVAYSWRSAADFLQLYLTF